MSIGSEKLCIASAIVAAVAILSAGLWIAIRGDHHALNRSGALIVCIEGLLVLVEFARRSRLRDAEEHLADNPYMALETRRAERQIVTIAATLAIIGEFVHGFGDLLIEFFVCHPSGT
ncbi:hypothetical protein ACU4GH_24570 [Bradyrhizobium betae]